MAFVDGELLESRAGQVGAHVALCATCREAVNELREVSASLSRWTVGEPPMMRVPVATRSMRANLARWFSFPRLLRWPYTVAASVVIAGLSVVWLTLLDGPRGSFKEGLARPDPTVVTIPIGEGYAPRRGPTVSASAAPVSQRRPGAVDSASEQSSAVQVPRPPQVVRRATLAIVAQNIDAVRSSIDGIVREFSGFVGEIQISGSRGEMRILRATLRVPGVRLDEAVSRLRSLGVVTDESLHGEDVTDQMVDLDARLTNARNTEKRLTEVLRTRTGDLADVLAVERETARVREEIERLDAQRKNLEQRVSYATITLTVSEERQAQLGAGILPIRAQLRNAFVEGVQVAYESVIAVAIALLRMSPFLLLWTIVLWWPVRRAYRAWRHVAPTTQA